MSNSFICNTHIFFISPIVVLDGHDKPLSRAMWRSLHTINEVAMLHLYITIHRSSFHSQKQQVNMFPNDFIFSLKCKTIVTSNNSLHINYTNSNSFYWIILIWPTSHLNWFERLVNFQTVKRNPLGLNPILFLKFMVAFLLHWWLNTYYWWFVFLLKNKNTSV